MRLTNVLLCPAVLLICFFAHEAWADVLAVTNLDTRFAGFVPGGVGFFFTPATDITMTQVIYEDDGATAPEIRVWANTNSVIARFPMTPAGGGGQLVSEDVSIGLQAGQRYSITLQDENPGILVISAYTNFALATGLSDYTSLMINAAFLFSDFDPTVFYQGVNFTFQTGAAPVQGPLLRIRPAGSGSAFVEWPVSASGFGLQHTDALGNPAWVPVTNSVTIVGATNQVTVSTTVSNQFYRLYHP
jgi:hypothetical protein